MIKKWYYDFSKTNTFTLYESATIADLVYFYIYNVRMHQCSILLFTLLSYKIVNKEGSYSIFERFGIKLTPNL